MSTNPKDRVTKARESLAALRHQAAQIEQALMRAHAEYVAALEEFHAARTESPPIPD